MKHVYKIFLTIVGAVIYRVRGGLVPAMPRPMDQILFALPFAAIVYKASSRNTIAFFIVLALTVLAIATGHGQYMDLGGVNYPVSPERLDFIVQLFFGDDNFHNYWRDFFGLAVTGAAVTLPAGIGLMIYKNYWQGAVLALSGASKALAYAIAWQWLGGTEWGEFLTGGFAWLGVILLWGTVNDRT